MRDIGKYIKKQVEAGVSSYQISDDLWEKWGTNIYPEQIEYYYPEVTKVLKEIKKQVKKYRR